MKMNIKYAVLTVFAVFIANIIFAQTTETRDLRPFTKIASYDGISVQLVPSNKNQAKVSGKSIDKLVTQVSGNTLKIKMNFGSNLQGEENHVIVYYDQDIDEIKAGSGSTITSNEKIKAKKIIVRSSEGAEIDLMLKSDHINSKIATGGRMKLSGSTDNLMVNISTGGSFKGKDLDAGNAEVNVSAGGEAEVNVEEILDATVNMGGSIFYYGNPKSVNESINLGGTIKGR